MLIFCHVVPITEPDDFEVTFVCPKSCNDNLTMCMFKPRADICTISDGANQVIAGSVHLNLLEATIMRFGWNLYIGRRTCYYSSVAEK